VTAAWEAALDAPDGPDQTNTVLVCEGERWLAEVLGDTGTG